MSASMKPTQRPNSTPQIRRCDKQMIMVGKDAPGVDAGGEMISALSAQSVRRTVPREFLLFAPGQEAGTLFPREFAPEVSHTEIETG